MIIIGNDIGLNNNAIVVCEDNQVIDTYYINLSKDKNEGSKLSKLYKQYLEIFSKYDNPTIIYEQPVMKGSVGASLNGVVSLLKMAIYETYNDKCIIIPVSPKTLKLNITGSGIANKKDMLFSMKELIEQGKIDCSFFSTQDFKNDHLIDALACCYHYKKINKN